MSSANPYNSCKQLVVNETTYHYYDIGALDEAGIGIGIANLPYSIRVLLEGMLRNCDGFTVTQDDIVGLANYDATNVNKVEMPFVPGRVILQDFTGVPSVVDLAAMRDAMKNLGGDPEQINPEVPCDLVIDHSVQVDDFATRVALTINSQREFERNNERYIFLKWGKESLDNFKVVPPATGIVHQVNLEYLAKGTLTRTVDGQLQVFADSLVGTDSHTTMINALGVVGWGVGGIEAEAVMLGQPVFILTPEVVGFKLTGELPEGATATDLVLTITQQLRAFGVVEKFVEFFGPGLAHLSLPDRATIANMAPEYGATMGFFPIDQTTIDYLKLTNRTDEQVKLAETYAKANHLWWEPGMAEPKYATVLELDISTVVPCVAGPKRPQDRIVLSELHTEFAKALVAPVGPQGLGVPKDQLDNSATVVHTTERPGEKPGMQSTLRHGSVVIAALTSCTNTSNPDVMVAAGLVARKANALGLTRKPWVKTSLAPGSKVVTEYFDQSGLTEDLDAIGFETVGYGCTTCIGNSGPLPPEVEQAIDEADLAVASVLSGNRNFEGRIHPKIRSNFLASPPLVVAYALAGRIDIDIYNEPLARTPDGKDVYLKDIWPTHKEVREVVESCINREQFARRYADVYTGNETWNNVPVSKSELYPWDEKSTYIQNPPFFEGMTEDEPGISTIHGARCLALLGDSVTTDHISPAGAIAKDSPAGQYLLERGVDPKDFNSYGSRRGNDRVMTRGTLANVRVRNRIAADEQGTIPEGGWTRDFTKGDTLETAPVCWIYDAAMHAREAGIPLVILAGKDYGMGSSRDWAAKGVFLLGVKAVIAQSFERIHRSNLVFMGVLPLVFKEGDSAESLGLRGDEVFDIELPDTIEPRMEIQVRATSPAGKETNFTCMLRLDSPVEIEYSRNGGILQTVIRKKLNQIRQGV